MLLLKLKSGGCFKCIFSLSPRTFYKVQLIWDLGIILCQRCLRSSGISSSSIPVEYGLRLFSYNNYTIRINPKRARVADDDLLLIESNTRTEREKLANRYLHLISLGVYVVSKLFHQTKSSSNFWKVTSNLRRVLNLKCYC